jgi:serine/threonine protein kinase
VHLIGSRQIKDTLEIAMDYAPGISLQQLELGEHLVRFIMRQLLSTLKYCHSMGVAHLDIKPANIILGRDNTIKLVDFGEARFFEPANPHITKHMSNGTLGYRKPGTTHAVEIDLYALGKTCKAICDLDLTAADNFIEDCLQGHRTIEQLMSDPWISGWQSIDSTGGVF